MISGAKRPLFFAVACFDAQWRNLRYWLITDWIPSQFSQQRKRVTRQYIDYVQAGVGLPHIWGVLKQQISLVDESFVKRMQRKIPKNAPLDEIPEAQQRSKARPLNDNAPRCQNPKEAISCAYQSGAYTMMEITNFYHVHHATVSRAGTQ